MWLEYSETQRWKNDLEKVIFEKYFEQSGREGPFQKSGLWWLRIWITRWLFPTWLRKKITSTQVLYSKFPWHYRKNNHWLVHDTIYRSSLTCMLCTNPALNYLSRTIEEPKANLPQSDRYFFHMEMGWVKQRHKVREQ